RSRPKATIGEASPSVARRHCIPVGGSSRSRDRQASGTRNRGPPLDRHVTSEQPNTSRASFCLPIALSDEAFELTEVSGGAGRAGRAALGRVGRDCCSPGPPISPDSRACKEKQHAPDWKGD